MITQPFIQHRVQNPPYDLECSGDGGDLHAIVVPLLVTKRPEYVHVHLTERYWISRRTGDHAAS